jgi:hypothetical protein
VGCPPPRPVLGGEIGSDCGESLELLEGGVGPVAIPQGALLSPTSRTVEIRSLLRCANAVKHRERREKGL